MPSVKLQFLQADSRQLEKCLNSTMDFAAKHPVITTALCALCTALIFQFYAVFYYGFCWFPSVLIVLALTSVISAPFWFFRLAQFITYCTFADSCSRIPRLLASSFVITLLLSGPVYRATVMMESSSESMQCAQAAIKEATRNVTDEFYDTVRKGALDALSGWNEKTAWLDHALEGVVEGRRGLAQAVSDAKSKAADFKKDCANALSRSKNKCVDALESVKKKLGPLGGSLGNIDQLCQVVDNGVCNGLSSVTNVWEKVDLNFLNVLNGIDDMLYVNVSLKVNSSYEVGSEAMTSIFAHVNDTAEYFKNVFAKISSVITYMTSAFLILTPLRNLHFLRTLQPPGKYQSRIKAILLYGNVVLVTAGVVIAYFFDFSLGHSYNNFVASVNSTSVNLMTDNKFEMQVSGGTIGMSVAGLLMQAVTVNFEVSRDIGIGQCFPALGETAKTAEVLKVLGVLVFLWIAAAADHYVGRLKVELKRVYRDVDGRPLAEASRADKDSEEAGSSSVPVVTERSCTNSNQDLLVGELKKKLHREFQH